MTGGTLHLTAPKVHIGGTFRQSAGTLTATVRPHGAPPLTVHEEAVIGAGAVLSMAVVGAARFTKLVPVLKARRIRGRFAQVVVTTPGYRASLVQDGDTISVRLHTS